MNQYADLLISVPTKQLQNTCAPKTQRSLWKSGWNDCNVELAVVMCLLTMSEAIHINSHEHDLPKYDLTKDNTNVHAHMMGASTLHKKL